MMRLPLVLIFFIHVHILQYLNFVNFYASFIGSCIISRHSSGGCLSMDCLFIASFRTIQLTWHFLSTFQCFFNFYYYLRKKRKG